MDRPAQDRTADAQRPAQLALRRELTGQAAIPNALPQAVGNLLDQRPPLENCLLGI